MVIDEWKDIASYFKNNKPKNIWFSLFKVLVIGNLWLWCIPFFIYENWYRIKRFLKGKTK